MPSSDVNACLLQRNHSNIVSSTINHSKDNMAAQMLASASAAPLAATKQCRLHSIGKPAQAALAGYAPFLQGKALRASRCCHRIERSSTAARCQGEYRVMQRTKSTYHVPRVQLQCSFSLTGQYHCLQACRIWDARSILFCSCAMPCSITLLHRAWFSAQLPLVGGEAPDFMAEAVYDQEFQTVTLSQYRVRPAG